MRRPMRWCALVLALGALVTLQGLLTAQAPAGAKRPLSYDVVDYWRSIQGTRLSADGQWLAYAVTSQAEDGELVVRNVRSGQEYRHPRGTGPTFSEDGRFCVFTIAQTKAEEEKERLQQSRSSEGQAGGAQTAGGQPGSGQTGGRGGQASGQRNQPRTGLGIMTLADGKVTTVEKVGSFLLPEESSAWLAYYKGVGGAGGGGGGRGGALGGRGGAGGGRRRNTTGGRGRARGGAGGRAAPGTGRIAREAQGPGLRPDPAQPGNGRGTDDCGSHRVPLRHEGPLACLRHLVGRRRQGRRLRASPERRQRHHAARGPRALQEPDLRRGGAPGGLPERPGRVRQARCAVPALFLEGRRRCSDRWGSRRRGRFPRGDTHEGCSSRSRPEDARWRHGGSHASREQSRPGSRHGERH